MSLCAAADVRPGQPSDIDAVTAIYAEAVLYGTGSFEIDPPGPQDMLRRFEDVVAAGYPFLVAADAERVKGFAYAGPFRARAAFKSTVEVSVYVAAQFRGAGIGRRLLEALIEETARRGFRQMLALIGDSRNAASIALHRRLGFTDTGLLRNVGFKHGRWLDVVVMQRSL